MKRVERILIKLLLVQLLSLLIAQGLLLHSQVSPYLTKIVDYEGVAKNNFTKVIETFDQ